MSKPRDVAEVIARVLCQQDFKDPDQTFKLPDGQEPRQWEFYLTKAKQIRSALRKNQSRHAHAQKNKGA